MAFQHAYFVMAPNASHGPWPGSCRPRKASRLQRGRWDAVSKRQLQWQRLGLNTQWHQQDDRNVEYIDHTYVSKLWIKVFKKIRFKYKNLPKNNNMIHDSKGCFSSGLAWEVLGWAARFDSLSWVVQERFAFLAHGPGAWPPQGRSNETTYPPVN